MKKIAFAVLLVIALVLSWRWYNRHHEPANEAATLPVVQAEKVKIASMPVAVHAVGTLVASQMLNITPEVAGHVDKIFFQDGASVKKGSPLVQLDDEIDRVKVASANAKLKYSESSYRRLQKLGQKGIIAQQTIDQVEADYKEKKADAEAAAVLMAKHRLVAPFDGALGKAQFQIGDYVSIGQTLISLTDNEHLRIEYNVPEQYLADLKLGQVVEITAAAYPGRVFTGKLVYKAPTINTANRSVELYAAIDNPDHLLAPGMFVNVTHKLAAQQKVVLVPARSIVPMLGGEQVFKYIDGKAQAINVEIGARSEKEVQVLKGLAEGDEVITDGQLKIRNGAAVKLKS